MTSRPEFGNWLLKLTRGNTPGSDGAQKVTVILTEAITVLTSGDLCTLGDEVLGVAGGVATPLAEALDVIHLCTQTSMN